MLVSIANILNISFFDVPRALKTPISFFEYRTVSSTMFSKRRNVNAVKARARNEIPFLRVLYNVETSLVIEIMLDDTS